MVLALALAVAAVAQQPNAAEKKKINNIKKSDQYLFAEVTSDNAQRAMDLAEEMLDDAINQYVASKRKLRDAGQYVARNTSASWERITLPRGDMFRAFIYVKKSDIIPADNVHVVASTPATSVEPIAATPTTATPSTPATPTTAAQSTNRQQVVSQLLTLTSSSGIQPMVQQLKRQGLVSDYNTYSKLADPSEYLLVVYNRDGQVEAILSDGVQRTNLRSGQADSVENYKGRGALGIKVNE